MEKIPLLKYYLVIYTHKKVMRMIQKIFTQEKLRVCKSLTKIIKQSILFIEKKIGGIIATEWKNYLELAILVQTQYLQSY